MKNIGQLVFMCLMSLGTYQSQAQVSVSSTKATAGLVSYSSLKDAFDAINNGRHQGAITVNISASIAEKIPATLNSGDAAPASYSSVLIRPVADGVSVSCPTGAGFGVIQLNGADHVTIDGDNPNSPGVNRDLTIVNNSASTAGYTSCIRIATSARATTANDIVIRNLSLHGNALGRNTTTAASTGGSENTSFGIYAGGKAGNTATDVPLAITSETADVAPAGTTMNDLTIRNNEVTACGRGIAFNGISSASSTGVVISGNVIGAAAKLSGFAPFTNPVTTVYTKGIWVNGVNALQISGNTIQNIISYVPVPVHAIELAGAIGNGVVEITNNNISGVVNNGNNATAPKAILISAASGAYTISGNNINNVQWMGGSTSGAQIASGIYVNTNAASATIEKNQISKIYNLNEETYGAVGITLNGGNNITVQNNVVIDILNNMTGGGAFSTQYSCYGIRFLNGSGHKVYSNTVHLSGRLMGIDNSSILTAALVIGAAAQTGMDVRNNIFSNTITGGTTSVAHVAVYMPTGGSELNLMINNNVYYSGTAPYNGIAQTGLTAGTGFYTASQFDPLTNKPSSGNFITYTQAAGNSKNDNSSAATTDPTLLNSNIDLALPPQQLELQHQGDRQGR